MKSLLLFTDGSAHPTSRIGYGAYLAIPDLKKRHAVRLEPATAMKQSEMATVDNLRMQIASNASGSSLETSVQLKRFEDTSSSQLEIETLIWALRETRPQTVTLYTDSQNIIGLPDRRERLEKQEYRSKTGALLNHAELYQEFFSLTDSLDCTLVKVKGHRRSHQKSPVDRLFTLVDRASRQALRAALADQ
jgi:ribonuclease HI